MKTLERLINASSDPDYYRHELKELDSSDKTRLQELAARLERAGAAQRALSEVTENIAQTARFFALRDLCAAARSVKEVLDCCDADDASAVSGALLKAGADRASLDRLVLAIAKSTVWHCLTAIDEGGLADDAPVGWTLAETDDQGKLTGRLVGGLHEDAQDEEFLGEFAG
jgi:hypothetical protein